MKLFNCPNCHQRLYFENVQCLSCGNFVVYDPDRADFVLSATDGVIVCVNVEECACNWRAMDGQSFCKACALNKTIPDLSIAGNRERWTRVELAKKRPIYSLLAYGLPVTVVRPFNTYGPHQRTDGEGGVVAIFCGRALAGEPIEVFGDGGASAPPVLTWQLNDVIVTALDFSGSGDIPSDSIALSYGRVCWVYTGQDSSGRPTNVRGCWDVKANKEL